MTAVAVYLGTAMAFPPVSLCMDRKLYSNTALILLTPAEDDCSF